MTTSNELSLRDSPAQDAPLVHLGLGSNLGDREANLEAAIDGIRSLGLSVTAASSVYETEPVGLKEQRWYLNQVIECAVPPTLLPRQLLSAVLRIEREMGRQRTTPSGPRVIDIDLLLWGGLVISGRAAAIEDSRECGLTGAGLTVPHPRMHLRRFVLEPLCEIAPRVEHPVLKRTCLDLLEHLDDPSAVRVFSTTS